MSHTRDSLEDPFAAWGTPSTRRAYRMETSVRNPAEEIAHEAESYRLLAAEYGLPAEIERDDYSAEVRIIGAKSSVVVTLAWTPNGANADFLRVFEDGEAWPVESLRSHLAAVKAGC
jgi:hypothetical protein